MHKTGDEVKVKIDGKVLNVKIVEKFDGGHTVKILTGQKGRPRIVDVVDSQIQD